MQHARLITMTRLLAGFPIHASAQLSEQLPALANQGEFIAKLSHRYDARLAMDGYTAVHQDACETLVTEYDRLIPERKKATNFEAASNVTQQILVLGQAEINTMKQRKGGKRPPR